VGTALIPEGTRNTDARRARAIIAFSQRRSAGVCYRVPLSVLLAELLMATLAGTAEHSNLRGDRGGVGSAHGCGRPVGLDDRRGVQPGKISLLRPDRYDFSRRKWISF